MSDARLTMFDVAGRRALAEVYRRGLLDDVVPFWMRHAIDHEAGGFLFSLDRDGSVLDTDKAMWIHGRFIWLLSTLYADVEARSEWLRAAEHGLEFLRRHGFDERGRMYFTVTRDGRPLRQRRYLFTEAFGVLALAAYARATRDRTVAEEALVLFRRIIEYHTGPGLLEPKVFPGTRRMRSIGMPMILIGVARVLRRVTDDPICDEWITRSLSEIERDFVRPDLGVVLENVLDDGSFVDSFDGRLLNPGHAIEAAWFCLAEAIDRGCDERLIALGRRILDLSWAVGWDEEHGGIIQFRDALGKPATEYWHDMKFWWPQAEAIVATALAYRLTGERVYADWHSLVHEWAHRRFPDPVHGEWFGYLHRDGRLSTPLKGNLWKGPFHIPRMQLACWRLLENDSPPDPSLHL